MSTIFTDMLINQALLNSSLTAGLYQGPSTYTIQASSFNTEVGIISAGGGVTSTNVLGIALPSYATWASPNTAPNASVVKVTVTPYLSGAIIAAAPRTTFNVTVSSTAGAALPFALVFQGLSGIPLNYIQGTNTYAADVSATLLNIVPNPYTGALPASYTGYGPNPLGTTQYQYQLYAGLYVPPISTCQVQGNQFYALSSTYAEIALLSGGTLYSAAAQATSGNPVNLVAVGYNAADWAFASVGGLSADLKRPVGTSQAITISPFLSGVATGGAPTTVTVTVSATIATNTLPFALYFQNDTYYIINYLLGTNTYAIDLSATPLYDVSIKDSRRKWVLGIA